MLRGVQQAELVEHDVDGPEVDGDVMHHQDEDMFVRARASATSAEDRADLQVERTIGLPA